MLTSSGGGGGGGGSLNADMGRGAEQLHVRSVRIKPIPQFFLSEVLYSKHKFHTDFDRFLI